MQGHQSQQGVSPLSNLSQKEKDKRLHILSASTKTSNQAQFNFVKQLLNANARFSERDKRGYDGFLQLVENGKSSLVQHCIEGGYASIEQQPQPPSLLGLGWLKALVLGNPDYHTPLFIAVERGHVEIVRFLIDQGVSPTGRDDEGNTLLISAVKRSHMEIAKYLLSEGVASPYSQNYQGEDITQILKQHMHSADIGVKEAAEGLWKYLNSGIRDHELNIPTTKIHKQGEPLGSGAYGTVHKGLWDKHTDVALKQMHLLPEETLERANESLLGEAKLMQKLRHPNIVQLYGVCMEDAPYTIVMEYCLKGSLQSVIEHTPETIASWGLRDEMIKDVVRGVSFLHSKHIVHRDLKSGNVLLTAHYQAKLADFGFSKLKQDIATTCQKDSARGLGTQRYMPPEQIKQGIHNKKSDVYSMGVVLWEIASRKLPFTTIEPEPNGFEISDLIVAGQRDAIDEQTRQQRPRLALAIQKCWKQERQERPMAKDIYQDLTQ